MSEILRAVGVMTVAGSALAVCLSALRPWLKNRLPKSVQYYLWLVVIAALLVPASRIVTLPVVINPVNSLKAVTERTEYALTPPQALAAALDSIGDAANGGLGTITVPVEAAYDGARETTELLHSQAWFALGSYAYPVGVLAVLMYFIIGNNVFLRRLRRRNVPAGIECRVPVYRNPLASTPMLIGVFRPAIVLPDKEYTDEQLEAVLRHELTHLHRRDILVRWLSVFACAVHWFNPIVWLTRREIDRACELSCDEAVIRSLDTDGKQSYGDTLLYVAAAGKTPKAVLSTTMCEDKKDLKERLGAIMKNRKYTKLAVLASAALITA
ncbi:MAG: M56 family metallopeptidase, partial [Oscillospiraceae bacterium]|nr:M56 family metallopeptidase [Oscillospiraceae bacterium]